MSRKIRILIVDDSKYVFEMIPLALGKVETQKFVCDCAENVEQANEFVYQSIINKRPYDAALVDLRIGKERGEEFAHRLLSIVVEIGVVIITSDPHHQDDLLGIPIDGKLIKDTQWLEQPVNLLYQINDAIAKSKLRINRDPVNQRARLWKATGQLGPGILALKPFDFKVSPAEGGTVLEAQITKAADGADITTVVYHDDSGDNVVPVSVHSTRGCDVDCFYCVHWRTENVEGKAVDFVRPLTAEEIVSQAYQLMIKSPQVRSLFEDGNTKKMSYNFTAAGDLLVNNLSNGMRAIQQMQKVQDPKIRFIITSVGHADRLQEYLHRYCDVPDVLHYWSVFSLIPEQRVGIMPGTWGQDLVKMRELYRELSRRTGKKVTASFSLWPGVNDTRRHLELIAEFFKDCPEFRIKLMIGQPGSLPGVGTLTEDDMQRIKKALEDLGLQDVRYRRIYGSEWYNGCGSTRPGAYVPVRVIKVNPDRLKAP